ncbi:hypothetical protein ACGFXC_03925 [Streptomyces sp. NPDC048507]|uniref:hypothetical protein n=1 Tax=Streptomyces sp. NPDC048507 TaxID=3365560 RepID=UPI00371D91A9
MKSIPRSRCARGVAAVLLSTALLGAGTAGAFAAATPKPSATPSASPAGQITVKADKSEVKAGDEVTFTGRTKGLKVGSKLVLQHNNKGKWTTLQSNTTVKNGSSYSLKGKLNTKGKEQLRVMGDDDTISPTVVVNVK